MAELSNEQIDQALAKGEEVRQRQPRASAARYDGTRSQIVVDLTNGCTFAFPPALAQGLEQASADQLEHVEILGDGIGLHWRDLDVDLSVPGLMAGIFGTQAYMARRAGMARSAAKADASRANGAKGGRPRKTA